jgi:hypothetical protein
MAINKEIKQAIDPDILGLRKRTWNTSVNINPKEEKED